MNADESAIRSVMLDYFEGWFAGDAVRMKRALHPALAKRSVSSDRVGLDAETAEGMIDATARGVGKARGPLRELDVRLIEVFDDIATVVVHSNVYREYLHLARTRDGWKIVNALWRFA